MTTYHPWRVLRSMSDWTLTFRRLGGGQWGETDFDNKTITLDPDLTQAERRCTLAHELEHVARGPVEDHRDERVTQRSLVEIQCELAAALRLLPDLSAIADALAWSNWSVVEAAQELWVDEFILQARLAGMGDCEKWYLRKRWTEQHGYRMADFGWDEHPSFRSA